jgi:hypothetical protein
MKNLTRYEALISARVSGIPCLIGVLSYERVKGSFNYNDVSDLDYSGYVQTDWELLDRRGYTAPWLARKATPEEIETVIANHFQE